MEELKKIIEEKGYVKENNVLHTDAFLNQQLDINLIHKMANEWKVRFKGEKITKILTIESAGIALATLAGLVFDVPVIYARKEYTNKLPENTYQAKIYSYTLKKSYYAHVFEEYLSDEDRVLIVDDVIANGWAAEGLCDLVSQAGADLVGIAVAIEKNYQLGGKRLRSKGIRVESLAQIKELDSINHKVIFDE